MSIKRIDNTENLSKNLYINRYLDKTKISDNIISEINDILNISNIDLILQKIEKFKENGKEIYQKYGYNLENKQKILDYILQNLSKLLNELKIQRVYNNTSYLLINNLYKNFDFNNIENFLTIEGIDFSIDSPDGVSCNEWVLFIYTLIKNIVGDDSDIKYNFQINSNDSHGLLYITIGDKKYFFDSFIHGFRFEKIELLEIIAKRKNKPKFFDNENDYKDSFIDGMNKKDSIVYDYLGKKLKIVKKSGFIMIIYKNKPLKYIKINGFKRITKNLSKIGSIKYVGLVPDVYNIDNIKDFIISKVKQEDREDVKIILSKIHIEKLLQFFNLSDL